MSSIANHVKDKFKGMLVFGDIHADYDSFVRAHDYALTNDLFFMSLGDLVDRGAKPFETVSHMARLMKDGSAGFTIGNHDNKFHRHSKGNKVSFSRDGNNTLATVGPERMQEFLEMYSNIVETPVFSGFFHRFDDIVIAHAASHVSMWDPNGKHSKTAEARMMYGETNGEMLADGYPVRLYNWIDEVPMGKTIIVGHDRMPIFDKPITEPLIRTNADGGKVVFMDTGCGKGGFLTGAVVVYGKHGFKIDKYVEFK